MKTQRNIIAYLATSADGYIARPDGDVEWLNRRPDNIDYGMKKVYPTIDTILWGRKTYDWLLNYYKKRGRTKGLFDTKRANDVFSRKPPKRRAPGVRFVSEPIKSFAKRLRATPGKHIWMMGGAASSGCAASLALVQEVPDGVVRLRYEVGR
jgi:dihydrofolate reductase